MGNQANSPGDPFLVGQLGSSVAPAHCQEHRGVSATPDPLWVRDGGSGPWRPERAAGGGRELRSRPRREGEGAAWPAGELWWSGRGCNRQRGPSSRRWGPGVPSCVGKKTGA